MTRADFALIGGAFLVIFGVGGLRQIFGVWVRPLEGEFGADRSSVALVASLGLLAFGLCQPILGRVVDAQGPRIVIPGCVLLAGAGAVLASFAGTLWQFALIWGLVVSIGFGGASNATTASLVTQRFEQRRGLIIGVCTAGAPLGQLVLAPLAAVSVAAFGWRDTMAIIGAALLGLVFPIAWALLRKMPAPSRASAPSLGERIARHCGDLVSGSSSAPTSCAVSPRSGWCIRTSCRTGWTSAFRRCMRPKFSD